MTGKYNFAKHWFQLRLPPSAARGSCCSPVRRIETLFQAQGFKGIVGFSDSGASRYLCPKSQDPIFSLSESAFNVNNLPSCTPASLQLCCSHSPVLVVVLSMFSLQLQTMMFSSKATMENLWLSHYVLN